MTGLAKRIPGRNSSTAVMAQRAPKQVDSDDPQKALWRSLDFFATPPWGTRAGAEIVRRLAPEAEIVWDPACGDGIMAEPLREYFPQVLASDIHDHGYRLGHRLDFLLDTNGMRGEVDLVMTNPPFALAAEFLQHGLEVARVGVALLLRLSFLESCPRYVPLYRARDRMTLCAPFCERLSMQLGPWNPEASSATAYAWFLFLKGREPMPIDPVPPGTEARLTRRDDIRRFVAATPTPLFANHLSERTDSVLDDVETQPTG